MLYENVVTNGAVAALGKTGFGAGCIFCCINNYGVAKCLYYLLLYENVVTNGAVATLGKTGFGAGCIFRCINNYGVTKCLYYLLLYENLVANRAVTTLGFACFGAGGGYCCINNLGVAECRDLFLCYDYFVALGAMLSLGFTGFGAGRSNCLIDNDDVLMLFGSGLFFGIDCGLRVRVLNVDQRNFVQKLQRTFTGCQSEQNHRHHNDQNECFEKIFHFSPSKNEYNFVKHSLLRSCSTPSV